MKDSYIIKYNISSYTVEDTIFIPGGPEGVEIANNKLYVALNYKDSIAVVDFDDNNSVSYIPTPAVTSYFLKDSDDIYVLTVPSYTDAGTLNMYGSDGTSKASYSVGVAPGRVFFLD